MDTDPGPEASGASEEGRRSRAALLCSASVFIGVHLWLLLAAARAIELPIPGIEEASLHGYYKNFFLVLDGRDALLPGGVEDLNRARLMLEARITDWLEFGVHYEQFATIHPVQGAGLFVGSASRPGIWDLSWSILSEEDVQWFQEIDRLYVRARAAHLDVTVGRQAIGWGVGVIWAPLDLFAAFSPVALDREFRVGIDAVRAIASLGSFSELEGVYAVYDQDIDQQSAALRWQTTLEASEVDVGLAAGKFFDAVVVGSYAAGQLAGIGLHASIALTQNYGDVQVFGPRQFERAVVGADYRFPGDVLLLGEYYLNGFGSTDPSAYAERLRSPYVQRGEIYNVGRHYLGFIADWTAHPLVHLLAQGQWNLLDPSAQVGPAVTVSLSDEAQLDAGIYFAFGAQSENGILRSEFGSLPNTYYLTGKIYF